MMRIAVIPDSFKGSLTSIQAASAIEQGLLKAMPEADIVKIPIADGGEGTVEAILSGLGGELHTVEVIGPLKDKCVAAYGILPDRRTAVLEMAAASGLPLISSSRRDPWISTSYGTGQMMLDAVRKGCKRIWIGIGGSATNDGGMGMAQALGVRFYDATGEELGIGAQYLERIAKIDLSGVEPFWSDIEVTVCTDVINPLCGLNGASFVYGPQKGASAEIVARLDLALMHYAEQIKSNLGMDVANVPGAGAAGGLGAGLLAFCQARLVPGMQFMIETVGIDRLIQSVQLVITGEGRTDLQTAYGKVPSGIGNLAKKYELPVICISGGIGEGVEVLYDHGISAIFSIMKGPMTLDQAMLNAAVLLTDTAENVLRTVKILKN